MVLVSQIQVALDIAPSTTAIATSARTIAKVNESRTTLGQHQAEIERNLQAWNSKPLLQKIYAGFYERILGLIDPGIPGRTVEVGSGIGNLKAHLPKAIATDLFPNSWLDLTCDGYELPFCDRALSHLVLFDVFHHLRAPNAFLHEARRVLVPAGRLILFEPYVSWASFAFYGLGHHEPVAWRQAIDTAESLPRPRDYYAAQGNATRLFFRKEIPNWPKGWSVFHAEALTCFHYLFSGGYSKPALYPPGWLPALRRMDAFLSVLPRAFAGRCLVGLQPTNFEPQLALRDRNDELPRSNVQHRSDTLLASTNILPLPGELIFSAANEFGTQPRDAAIVRIN